MEPDVDALRARLLPPHGTFAAVDVVDRTGSTNADLVGAARAGAADRTVLIAREQTAGRGRRARVWASPAGPGLYGSVLFRLAAPLPPERVGWLTLLGGMAVVDVASEVAGVGGVTVKWPNDVLAGGAKLAGVLAEAVPSAHGLAVVLGIGVNVRPLPNDPEPGAGGLPATSFVDEAASVTDLTDLAGELYERLDGLYQRWQEAGGDAVGTGLHAEYCARCATIGARVRVEMPDESITGAARDIDVDGRLVLQLSSGDTRVVSAGDVVHLRTEPTRYRGGETTDR